MDWLIVFYLGFIFIYRLGQFYAILKSRNLYKPDHSGDWALAIVWVPFLLVIIGAPYEYFLRRESPDLSITVLGGIFFISAILLRGQSLADLTREFFVFEDKNEKHQLITKGIYMHIRHPLYLANILLMIACTLFLGSYAAAGFSLVGIIGINIKINLEEEILESKFVNFQKYKDQTGKLFPRFFKSA